MNLPPTPIIIGPKYERLFRCSPRCSFLIRTVVLFLNSPIVKSFAQYPTVAIPAPIAIRNIPNMRARQACHKQRVDILPRTTCTFHVAPVELTVLIISNRYRHHSYIMFSYHLLDVLDAVVRLSCLFVLFFSIVNLHAHALPN